MVSSYQSKRTIHIHFPFAYSINLCIVSFQSRPPQTGWVPGSYFETPAEYYRQKRTTREITNGDLHMTLKDEALAKRE